MSTQRQRQLSATLARTLSDILQKEYQPTDALVTVRDAKVSKHVDFADVYVGVLPLQTKDTKSISDQHIATLQTQAAGLRSQLASALKWRRTPALRFHLDELPEQANTLAQKITQLL